MPRIAITALFSITLLSASIPAGAGGSTVPSDVCRPGAARAAHELVNEQASITRVSTIAGLDTATAVDPRITPGFATALLRIDDAWCSVDLFNAAAAEQLPGAGPVAVASAFASVAAMPYLGDVIVHDAIAAGPVVTLITKGGRHHAVSRWTILVDAAGVRSASFTTTGWDRTTGPAVLLDTHGHGAAAGDLEGITSLPGHTRTFARSPDGRIRIDATVDDLLAESVRQRRAGVARAAAAVGLAPGDDLKHTFEDGYTIKVSYGLAPYTPDTGVDTGVTHADRLRTIFKGVVSHYKDFVRWGVRNPFNATGRTLLGGDTGLPEKAGYVNVDSPMAPVCLACAYLTEAIEVHIAFLFPELAQELVAVSYPDSEKFMQTVIGHEMVHGLQGGYGNGQAGSFTSAFVEGAARASESLHDIAGNTFQTGAIHFNDNSNGCEGFENGRGSWISAQASGPFNGHSYDACYFWWSYYATHGGEGMVNLLEALPEAAASSATGAAARNVRLLEVAAEDGNGGLDLARWGAAFAAGNDADGYTIPAGQTGTSYNWMSLLRPAQRAADLQLFQNVSVSAGGARAYLVRDEATITSLPGGLTCVFDNVERQLVPHPAEVGTAILPGQIVTVVAPTAGTVTGTLALAPGPVEPPTEPAPIGCG